MPLYEVECPEHGRFEVSRKYSESHLIRCPACKTVAKHVMNPVVFSFGWRLSDESHNIRGHKDELVRDV